MTHDFEGTHSALPASIIARALGAQLEVLLAPGEPLYNPLFCGPLASGDALSEMVATLGRAHGVPVVTGAAEECDVGYWVLDLDGAESLLARGVRPGPVQWIVWAPCDAAALPDRMAAWLGRGGFSVRVTAALPRLGSVESAVGDAVMASAGGEPAFVVVAVEPAGLPAACAEVCLHLELAGIGEVARLPLGGLVGWLDRPRGTPIAALRLADLRAVEPMQLLSAVACGRGVAGLVLDADTYDWVSVDPAWREILDRSVVVQRLGASAVVAHGMLPSLDDLLVVTGPREVEAAMSFSLSQLDLGQVLQTAGAWDGPAELLFYAPGKLGRVEIAGGRIACVSPHPACRLASGPATEGEMLSALYGVSLWQEASVVLLNGSASGEPGAGDGIPVSNAAFALAMGTEAGTASPALHPPLRAVEVAGILAERGLSSAAILVLERAARDADWSAGEEAMLGRLLAVRDPHEGGARLRHAAMRALEDPAGADVAIYVDATLSALLIEVRGGATVPASALSVVSDWVARAVTTWVLTPIHAAIWMELALRAGATADALQAQNALRNLAGDSPGPWWGLLALVLAGDCVKAGDV
jgi:hypothetical protein